MIKAGIAGAHSRMAGELIRILVSHPDIIIKQVASPEHAGLRVSSVHHGLIGEEPIVFTSTIDLSALDILFICSNSDIPVSELSESFPELKIVDLSGEMTADPESEGAVLAISEIYRKPLVRGARIGIVPPPFTAIALIALYPLAAHMIINQPLHLNFQAPSDLCREEIAEIAASMIRHRLNILQPSFDYPVEISAQPTEHNRACRLTVKLRTQLAIDEIMRLYDSIYDDHNFTFMVSQPADANEVSGTHKCIISLRKPDEATLEVDALADCRMRGGAGEAVHTMNLLFGLHEKVGLSFKAAKY